MTTLIIEEDSLEARKFIEYARTLPFVKEITREDSFTVREPEVAYEKATDRLATHPVWEVMPRRMTMEEYREMAEQALEDVRQGRVISHEEMGKKIAQWR